MKYNNKYYLLTSIIIYVVLAATPIGYDIISSMDKGENIPSAVLAAIRNNLINSILILLLMTITPFLWGISGKLDDFKNIKQTIVDIKSIEDSYNDIHRRLESLIVNYNSNRQYYEVCMPELKKMFNEDFGNENIVKIISSYMFRADKPRLDKHKEEILKILSDLIVEKGLSCEIIFSFKHNDYKAIDLIIAEINFRIKILKECIKNHAQEIDSMRTLYYIYICHITSHDILLIKDISLTHYNAIDKDGARNGFMIINNQYYATNVARFDLLKKQHDDIDHLIKEKIFSSIEDKDKHLISVAGMSDLS